MKGSDRGECGMLGWWAGGLLSGWENGGAGERVGERKWEVRQAGAGGSGRVRVRACPVCCMCLRGRGGELTFAVKTGRSHCLAICEAPARAGVEAGISPPRLKLDISLTCVRVRQQRAAPVTRTHALCEHVT